jgi:hypothetical protein
MIGTWLFYLEVELAWFPMHFERDVYTQQMLLVFRRRFEWVS